MWLVPKKKVKKKKSDLPTLQFLAMLPETHLFLAWPDQEHDAFMHYAILKGLKWHDIEVLKY